MTMNKSQRPAEIIFLKTENLWFLSDKFDPACLHVSVKCLQIKKNKQNCLSPV